jgi:hypothetical protein
MTTVYELFSEKCRHSNKKYEIWKAKKPISRRSSRLSKKNSIWYKYFSLDIHIIFSIITLMAFTSSVEAAGILGGLGGNIPSVSIDVGTPASSNIFDVSRDLGLRILTALRLLVSGFALVYLVLIGVYMIVFSETEDRIKTQRKQIIYALVGFLFLNIP